MPSATSHHPIRRALRWRLPYRRRAAELFRFLLRSGYSCTALAPAALRRRSKQGHRPPPGHKRPPQTPACASARSDRQRPFRANWRPYRRRSDRTAPGKGPQPPPSTSAGARPSTNAAPGGQNGHLPYPARPSPDKTTVLAPASRSCHRWPQWCRAAAAIALVCAVLGGCTGEQFQKGYILPPGALEQIPIGASQDQVLIVMGTPSTVATLNGEVFYYISQRSERPIAFMNQKVVDQRVIAIYFDRNRQVQRLANYGLQDGKIFDFISRTTPTSGQELSYLTPLFKLLSFN